MIIISFIVTITIIVDGVETLKNLWKMVSHHGKCDSLVFESFFCPRPMVISS